MVLTQSPRDGGENRHILVRLWDGRGFLAMVSEMTPQGIAFTSVPEGCVAAPVPMSTCDPSVPLQQTVSMETMRSVIRKNRNVSTFYAMSFAMIIASCIMVLVFRLKIMEERLDLVESKLKRNSENESVYMFRPVATPTQMNSEESEDDGSEPVENDNDNIVDLDTEATAEQIVEILATPEEIPPPTSPLIPQPTSPVTPPPEIPPPTSPGTPTSPARTEQSVQEDPPLVRDVRFENVSKERKRGRRKPRTEEEEEGPPPFDPN